MVKEGGAVDPALLFLLDYLIRKPYLWINLNQTITIMNYICMNCQEQFDEPSLIDEGIGDYEYGGATGRHVDLVAVSPCCGEDYDLVDDEE